MKKALLWRPAVTGENWMQSLFRMMGNLVQWFLVLFLLFCFLILALEAAPSADERYAKRIKLELDYTDRPENVFWKFDKVEDSSFTYDEFIPTLIEKGLSSPIKALEANEDCNKVVPLLITLKNTGKKTIHNVNFTLGARKQNRSTDILPSTDKYRSLDFIIAPGESIQRCLPVSVDVQNKLVWEAKVTRVVTQ